MKIVLVAIACVVGAGCASQPWYHKLEARSPECVRFVKGLTCQQFVDSSQRMRSQIVWMMQIRNQDMSREEWRLWATTIDGINQDLVDVGTCQ